MVMVSTDLYAIRPDPIKLNILITFYKFLSPFWCSLFTFTFATVHLKFSRSVDSFLAILMYITYYRPLAFYVVKRFARFGIEKYTFFYWFIFYSFNDFIIFFTRRSFSIIWTTQLQIPYWVSYRESVILPVFYDYKLTKYFWWRWSYIKCLHNLISNTHFSIIKYSLIHFLYRSS